MTTLPPKTCDHDCRRCRPDAPTWEGCECERCLASAGAYLAEAWLLLEDELDEADRAPCC